MYVFVSYSFQNFLDGDRDLEHTQILNRLQQEKETQEMESGELLQTDSVNSSVSEIPQNGQDLVKVVHLSGAREEREGKMRIAVECRNLKSLESLWQDYRSGHLNTVAEKYLLTDDIKERFGVESIDLETTILEGDYLACKQYLSENLRKFTVTLLISSRTSFFFLRHVLHDFHYMYLRNFAK